MVWEGRIRSSEKMMFAGPGKGPFFSFYSFPFTFILLMTCLALLFHYNYIYVYSVIFRFFVC